MKAIFGIFCRDVKRICHNPIALLVTIGIIILPSLYAWFNIAASWDPYGNTNGVNVAVANTDAGYEIAGISLHIGDDVIENLKANDQIGWQFMSEQEALTAVESGQCFAAVVIPSDFSEKLASILTTNIQKPQIEYYVNEKKNAIAPKITDKGVSAIQQQINKTFIETTSEVALRILNEADDVFVENKGSLLERLRTTLDATSQNLASFRQAIAAFCSGADAISALITTLNHSLPSADSLLEAGQTTITDSRDLINASRNISNRLVDDMGGLLNDAENTAADINNSLQEIFVTVETDTSTAARLLGQLEYPATRMLSTNQKIADNLKKINRALPKPLTAIDRITNKMDTQAKSLRHFLSLLDDAQNVLITSGTLPNDLRQQLQDVINDNKEQFRDIRSTYDREISGELSSAIDLLYDKLDDITVLLNSSATGLGHIQDSLESMGTVMTSSKEALQSTSSLLAQGEEKINAIRTQLDGLSNDEAFQKLQEILANDPAITGSFLSEPVEVHTNQLYPIENYGSAMTPFYSILAIWVGGLILVAIVKCQVKEDEIYHSLKPYQTYFGRYLLFMVIGLLQALVIVLGDLFILKIYCVDKLPFVLCALLASIVFTNMIYTLTLTFTDVGKAIAVILLVLQVAGAGGTFPVEVMPTFFRILNPLLPFTHGINAMRECVGGIYPAAFTKDLIYLSIFLLLSLTVALLFRKPLMRAVDFFERKLEETHLM